MSGTIPFKFYPANQRTHGVFAEINPQLSGGAGSQRTLIVGQMRAVGTAEAGVAFLGTSQPAVNLAAGAGSILARMYQQYRGQDSFGETWLLPLADPSGGVAASNIILFAGTTTAAGTVSLYVGGTLYAVPVASGTAAAAVAASVAAAVAADPDALATASMTNGQLTFTANNQGVVGNEIDVRINYLGTAGGEALPPGLTFSAANPQLINGAGVPTTGLQAALPSLGDMTFDGIVSPFTDGATLNVLAAFLSDSVGRWSWQQQLYGFVFTAIRGTAGALTTFGTGRNDYTMSGMGFYDSPTPAWLWAADYAGAAMVSLRADPGLPLQELALNVLAPPVASRFPIAIRNTLLFDGISTFVVNDAGQAIIDQAITFYQQDASLAPDTTWLYVETPFQVVDLTRDMRNRLQTTYGRKKLVADGSNIAGGSNQVTAQTVLATALGIYKGYCDAGRAQNYAAFKAGAQSQNAGGGRLNLQLPFVLDSQLRQIVMSINFIANS